jgi:hypothetical protein
LVDSLLVLSQACVGNISGNRDEASPARKFLTHLARSRQAVRIKTRCRERVPRRGH